MDKSVFYFVESVKQKRNILTLCITEDRQTVDGNDGYFVVL